MLKTGKRLKDFYGAWNANICLLNPEDIRNLSPLIIRQISPFLLKVYR